MKEPGVDVAVLLMFFCRPQPFAQVFEQVRIARPSRLYLHQDGPRPDSETDWEGILECREIASQVDWDCEVHRLYRAENIGCGPAQYLAERWMFQHEETGIVLEDDVVPSQSFFPFCAELLMRYRDDSRIDRICGMNNLGTWGPADSSYFFAATGSIVGWASWSRVVGTWDSSYEWLDDARALRLAGEFSKNRHGYRAAVKKAVERRSSGQAFHETAGGFAQLLNSRLMIVPRENMISLGISAESSHAPDDLRMLPTRSRRLFEMRRHEIEFPLKHPQYVQREEAYERLIATTPLQEALGRIESVLRAVLYGGPSELMRRYSRRQTRRRDARWAK